MMNATLDIKFWESSECHLMLNNRDPSAVADAALISPWLESHRDLDAHCLFATSGSTGRRKWVALSKAAMLSSAKAVNAHLGVDSSDRWLLALPLFHVGGMGILARCYAAGCDVISFAGKWDPLAYQAQVIRARVTYSSLVPTQLVDLVALLLPAPPSLRAVLIGGGRLDDATYQKAIELGWPVVETYGMTEACSQVATAQPGDRTLKILPSWMARTTSDHRLMLKGKSLLTGYVQCVGENVSLTNPLKNGWFLTGDIAEITEDSLVINGRSDRCVKVLGELVNLDEVERNLNLDLSFAETAVVVAVQDTRRGSRIIICSEGSDASSIDLSHYHAHCHPLHRIDSVIHVESIPRSPLNKVLYAQLAQIVSS